VPIVTFVNKLDREDLDPFALIGEVARRGTGVAAYPELTVCYYRLK
jgi:peptide subunit release factor RF-3